jgi:hypothetical protein
MVRICQNKKWQQTAIYSDEQFLRIFNSNYAKLVLCVVAVTVELSKTLRCVISPKNKPQAVRCNLLSVYVHYFDDIRLGQLPCLS